MYFSLITPARGQELAAARIWHGAYDDHQWLWRFFPAPAGGARCFLFRRHEKDQLPRYYVVSAQLPQAPCQQWLVQSKPYTPHPGAGSLLHFELRANPVVTHQRSGDGKKRRHDVVMQAKRQLLDARGLRKWADWKEADRPANGELVWQAGSNWLQMRAGGLGVEFLADTLRVDGYQQHRASRSKDGNALYFSTLDFSGQLLVRDPVLLAQALTQGIGHAKGFGCGLLLVRPVLAQD